MASLTGPGGAVWRKNLIQKSREAVPLKLSILFIVRATQVLADLKLAPRVEREGLFVRWAGKKRDIVDEVLVRELQVGTVPNMLLHPGRVADPVGSGPFSLYSDADPTLAV